MVPQFTSSVPCFHYRVHIIYHALELRPIFLAANTVSLVGTMRFLDIKSYEIKEIKKISGIEAALAQCAVISHRWGDKDDELTFKKYNRLMKEPSRKRHRFENPGRTPSTSEGASEGLLKAARSCLMAREFGVRGQQTKLKYIWLDTCCIDKSDAQELQEAINSMFRWYSGARICYAYLPDVSKEEADYQQCEKDMEGNITRPRIGSFEDSDWFTRGWTLQELLAPREMYFFDRYWRPLGSKVTLSAQLQSATKIEAQYLHGNVSKACIATKMSWLARRETSKIEDMAYCMFGLFEVSTYVKYGEGEAAFLRLQEELIKQRPGDESIFAWKSSRITTCGLLAPWPTCYLGCENLTVVSTKFRQRKPYTVANGGVEFQLPNKLAENGNARDWMALRAAFRTQYDLKLNCWVKGVGSRDTITITLCKISDQWRRVDCNEWKYSWKPRSSLSIFGAKARPVNIPKRVEGEENWGYVLAREQQREREDARDDA